MIESHQKKEEGFWRRQLRAAWWLNIVTTIAAIGGIFTLVAIYETLNAALKANQNAVEALHQSQRPWVVADLVQVTQPVMFNPDKSYVLNVDIFIQNFGQSISLNTYSWAAIRSNALSVLTKSWNGDETCSHIDEVQKQDRAWPLGEIIGPGQKIPIKERWTSSADSPDEDSIKSGHFILAGCIEYKDQYSIDHQTRFAFDPYPNNGAPWDLKTFLPLAWFEDAH